MEKRIAMIKDGVVENIAAWIDDQGWWDAITQMGYVLVDITDNPDVAQIGYTYADGIFTSNLEQ